MSAPLPAAASDGAAPVGLAPAGGAAVCRSTGSARLLFVAQAFVLQRLLDEQATVSLEKLEGCQLSLLKDFREEKKNEPNSQVHWVCSGRDYDL